MSQSLDEVIGNAATLVACPHGRGRPTITARKGDFEVWNGDIAADTLSGALHLPEGSTITLPATSAFVVRGSRKFNHMRCCWR